MAHKLCLAHNFAKPVENVKPLPPSATRHVRERLAIGKAGTIPGSTEGGWKDDGHGVKSL